MLKGVLETGDYSRMGRQGHRDDVRLGVDGDTDVAFSSRTSLSGDGRPTRVVIEFQKLQVRQMREEHPRIDERSPPVKPHEASPPHVRGKPPGGTLDVDLPRGSDSSPRERWPLREED